MRQLLAVVIATACFAPAAIARPYGPTAFCEAYPDSPTCAGQMPTCKHCHTLTGPLPEFNNYGLTVFGALAALGHDPEAVDADDSYISRIVNAILDSETDPVLDHDGDGVTTTEEIALGTNPGELLDFFLAAPPPVGAPNPEFNIGGYDVKVAYQRMHVAFCGRSLSYDERNEFNALNDDNERQAAMHTKLDECIDSSFWRDEALPKLADDRIKPIPRFEQWRWDYRLWRYANLPPCDTGDLSCGDDTARSARDLLTGDYHVRERIQGQLTRNDGAADAVPTSCPVGDECGFDELCQGGTCVINGGTQPLQDTSKRAGMITTTWFHFFFTMFSDMPRTTAAQAMRAYVGVDFAQQQGLTYNPDEPADVDNKGVAGDTCYECHMHLDAATYPFAYYNGIGGGAASTFNANRPELRGLWGPGEDRQGYFFETPVADLPDWADKAAESDFFKRHHALTFFRYGVGRAPRADEAAEFRTLWESMDADNYETPALLHRLIDTVAFGGV